MSRAFWYGRRASSLMSSGISGSALSTAGMGGICMTFRLHTAAGAGHEGGPQGRSVPSSGAPQDDEKADMATRIILDCDPGIDDALAIAFAHGHPGIDLVGITTVAGNVGLARTTANALAVCEDIGAAGTPVTARCGGALPRPALDARQVHGASG